MPLLDKLISTLSPEWSARRMAWRKVEASYKGGVPTRTSEGWLTSQGYRFGTSSERYEVMGARDRAYNAYDNNPVAQTLVDVETDNVIGDGLNYQPTSKSEAWNREAKDRYYEWIEGCSVRGADVEPGCEVQRMLWTYSRVAGDIGWVLVSRGPDSFIQTVRAENIVTPDGMAGDNAIYDGIRFDAFGKPLTFYILNHDDRTGRRAFVPIPARDFVWLPHMTKPGQSRPPSCYVTIFDLLSHLDRYVDGVSLAAWMATVIGLVFKKTTPSTAFGALPLSTNSQGDQQRTITLENGAVKYIGTDEEVAQVQAHQPLQQTPEFIRSMYRMLGQPFKMPLEVIAMDMSTATFASARIGLLPFYRQCRIKAARFGSRWSRTIRWWLSRERLRDRNDPKRWVTDFPEDYWNHDLLPNEWDYTDPVSEVQSDMLQIDAGFKSVQMVMNERGRDAQLILQQRKDWNKLAKDLPQMHSTMSRDAKPPGMEEPNQPPADPANEDNTDDDDTN